MNVRSSDVPFLTYTSSMCGIAGTIGYPDTAAIVNATESLTHRGPDASQIVGRGPAFFGFTRLAIVDLANGMQPFQSSDGRFTVVVNGEIYNYLRLREELSGLGHVFRTRSDCEVVLHAFEEWGAESFARLQGMFAIAIWDDLEASLFLARDRLGKKPLYWSSNGYSLAFGSELKALEACGIDRKLDELSLYMYLRTDSVPTPRSILANCNKLPAGSYLQWSPGTASQLRCYWHPQEIIPSEFSATDIEAHLDSLLTEATKDRLMADVPIGVLLSSGTDSMLIASKVAKLSHDSVPAFTLRFANRTYDESREAQAMAHSLGLKHYIVEASTQSLASELDHYQAIFDEPLNDPAALAMLILSKEARRHVKVVLTGDGGDELFLGYQHLAALSLMNQMPERLQKASSYLQPLLSRVRDNGDYFSFGFKSQRLARGLGYMSFLERDLSFRGAFTHENALRILGYDADENQVPSQIRDLHDSYIKTSPYRRSDWDIWSWAYLHSYLLDTVLVKVDRATMASGLEARSPLLDQRVVEYALSLPHRFKMGKFSKKKLLRDITPPLELGDRSSRGKHGMGIPVRALLTGPLSERFRDLTAPNHIKRQGIFDLADVESLVLNFLDGKRDLRKEAWGLFMFQIWWERGAH